MKLVALMTAAATAIVCASGASDAEQVTREQLCGVVAPQMLEFAQAIPEIPQAFERTYAQLSQEDQVRFSEVRESGNTLADVAKMYRNSFLKACFSE